MSDNVNHPSHYQTEGGLEVIDIINSILGSSFEAYYVGNIIKYVSRYKKKNGLEDLKKARWYLDYLINYFENEVINDEVERVEEESF